MLLGGIVGGEVMRVATKVSKAHLDEALQSPDSFEVKLQDITEMRTKKEFGAYLLIIQCSTPGVSGPPVQAGSLVEFQGVRRMDRRHKVGEAESSRPRLSKHPRTWRPWP